MVGPGDVVLTPTPTYPIHMYGVVIAGGDVRGVALGPEENFFENLGKEILDVRDFFPENVIPLVSINPKTYDSESIL